MPPFLHACPKILYSIPHAEKGSDNIRTFFQQIGFCNAYWQFRCCPSIILLFEKIAAKILYELLAFHQVSVLQQCRKEQVD